MNLFNHFRVNEVYMASEAGPTIVYYKIIAVRYHTILFFPDLIPSQDKI